MDRAIEIANLFSEVSKRDQRSLTIELTKLSDEERRALLKSFEKLEQAVSEKTKKAKKEEKKIDKNEEVRRFLQRLQAKIEENLRNDVVVKTRFDGLEDLLRPIDDSEDLEDSEIQTRFKDLVQLVEDLDIIKCLANFAQGRLIIYLQQKRGLTLAAIAIKLKIAVKYTERLANFAKFASRYRGLLCSSYSMDTILKFKSAIEHRCDENANFASLLEEDPLPTFSGGSAVQDDASTSPRRSPVASASGRSGVTEMEEDEDELLNNDLPLFRDLRF